jgi:hypothetical protein
MILVLIGLFSWTIVRHQSKRAEGLADRHSLPPNESQSNGEHTDVNLSAAVNQLFSSVDPSLPENQYFPQFTKERVLWITTEKNGQAIHYPPQNTNNTNLYFEDLMASKLSKGNR